MIASLPQPRFVVVGIESDSSLSELGGLLTLMAESNTAVVIDNTEKFQYVDSYLHCFGWLKTPNRFDIAQAWCSIIATSRATGGKFLFIGCNAWSLIVFWRLKPPEKIYIRKQYCCLVLDPTNRITSRATGGGVFGRLRGHPQAHYPVYVVGLEKSRVYPGLNVTFVMHPDPDLHTNLCAASDATSRCVSAERKQIVKRVI
jgi:hypothetical protein